jgi:peptidoglycan/LPS O-acetylase OafA/YrhL
MLTPFRLDGLCLGGLAAWILRERPTWCRFAPPVALVTWGPALLCLKWLPPWKGGDVLHVLVLQQLASVATAALILSFAGQTAARFRWAWEPVRGLGFLLALAPMRWIGTVSYGLYMYHPLVLEGLQLVHHRLTNEFLPAGLLLLAMVATLAVGVASASWIAFERPLLALASRFGAAPVASAASNSATPAAVQA